MFQRMPIALSAVMMVTGCSNQQMVERPPFSQKVGQNCTIQLRRGDGLGAAGDLPVSPTTGVINGAEVSVTGKLRAVADGWVAVEVGNAEYCIPRESILLIQF